MLNDTIEEDMRNYGFDEKFVQKVLGSFYVDYFSGNENTIGKVFDLSKKLKIRLLEGLFCFQKQQTNDSKLRGFILENNKSEVKPSKILGIT